MKKVLALALLSSVAGMQAVDMTSLNAMMADKGLAEKCIKLCMVPVALCVAQKMMCKDKAGCPMNRGATDASNTLSEVTDKLADGSVQAVLQRVFSPLQNYTNDWQSMAVDTVVNAVASEADSRLGISACHPKLQALVQTSAGKLAFVSAMNAAVKYVYTYVQSKVTPATVAAIAKK